MIDINIIRQNPKLVEDYLKKRQDKEKIAWLNQRLESLQEEVKAYQDRIAALQAE